MISFMVLSSPRSGSTWASNWLSTDRTHCIHDPLWNHHYTELDGIESSKLLGVACTGLAMFPDWVNAHPARKVILHRPLSEINASLELRGCHTISQKQHDMLDGVEGMHVLWRDLFEKPAPIYEYLTGLAFDPERHKILVELNVQNKVEKIVVKPEVIKRFLDELKLSLQ